MIRFPERYHASDTPGEHVVCEEPNYREDHRASKSDAHAHHKGRRREHFDFTALAAALEH